MTPDWFRAIGLVRRDTVYPLAFYPDPVRASDARIEVPSVVVVRRYVRAGRGSRFTQPSKRNLLIRDQFACAYCGCSLTMKTVTRDHVLPTSRGGPDTLQNVVACCGPCNSWKDNRTPDEAGMRLRVRPRALTEDEKLEIVAKTCKAFERRAWSTVVHATVA